MGMERRPWLLLVLKLVTMSGQAHAQLADSSNNAARFVGACSRACGAYETCFSYEGAEFCAPFCAPGRCNDTAETCIVEGRACDRAPCVPAAVCEPKVAQPPSQQQQQQQSATNGSIDNDVGAPQCGRPCPMVDAPVCGSNGVTYANVCFLEQAQCVAPSLTLVSAQLCATDVAFNLQYNNATTTTSANDQTSVPIPKPECDAIVCSAVQDPVCTTNGTMANLCFFTKAQCVDPRASLLKRTACEAASGLVAACPANCTEAFVPVCGSNGVVYGNECLFRQAKCERRAYGELRAKDLSDCALQVGDSQGAAVDVAVWLALAGTIGL